MAAGSKYEILVEHWGGEPGVDNPFDVFKEVGTDLVALGGDPEEVRHPAQGADGEGL